MLDVNGTRHHLLLGRDDWGFPEAPVSPPDLEAGRHDDTLAWDRDRREVSLRPKIQRFHTGRGDRAPTLDDHRDAAMDRHGSFYWIDPARSAILVSSSGTGETTTFWPTDEPAPAPLAGAFAPTAKGATSPWALAGLVVTSLHYLVVIGQDGAGRWTLLAFDLHGGGAPLEMLWPDGVALDVRGMAPAPGGGIWVLDRANRRYWRLDRHLRIERRPGAATVSEGAFGPSLTPAQPERSVEPSWPVSDGDAWGALAVDPIAIEGLPDGSVMVLDDAGEASVLRVITHHHAEGSATSEVVATLSVSVFRELLGETALDEASPSDVPPLTAHALDVAFVPDEACPWNGRGKAYLVSSQGNQAFVALFTAGITNPLQALADYVPMRLHHGLGVITAGGQPYYDSNGRWIPLKAQRRPRFDDAGALETRVLDAREPACVWHRLMLDAAIPGGAAVTVWSRASDERAEIASAPWIAEPAFTYRRSDGSEIPWSPRGTREGEGTWEILLQNAVGRYLQLKLALAGDGVRSPSLRAMRVWYPRFSYRDRYLPAVYREQDDGGFVERFLANVEGLFTSIEDRIAGAQMLFDVRSCPPEALDWLASWFGVLLDPAWDERRRRLFIRHAMQFFQMRGTVRGLRAAVALATMDCVDERLFSDAGDAAYGPFGVRVVELFRARDFPAVLLGDASGRDADASLVVIVSGERWRPSEGLTGLRVRYGNFLSRWNRGEPPIDAPPDDGRSVDVPEAFPTRAPSGDAGDAWRAFVREALVMPDLADGVDVQGWRRYLEARYRVVSALQAAHGTTVTSFATAMYPDPLGGNARVIEDWYRYESAARPSWRTAGRFTVLLPVPAGGAATDEALQQRLKVAARVVALEKPAHTCFDVGLYWAMFRVGRARLGYDTLIDVGGRAPDLMPPAVAGRAYLGQAYVDTRLPDDAIDRRLASGSTIGRIAGPSQETRT